MLNFAIIQVRETNLNCHKVFAQYFSGLNMSLFLDEINLLNRCNDDLKHYQKN